MTPAPSRDHQRLALALHDVLTSFLRVHSIGEALVAPADLEFSYRRLLEPVVFVVPRSPDRPRPRSYADAKRLLLAIKLLSSSTARRDRGVQRRIFIDEHVDKYWIVDADAWCIERWRRWEDRPIIVMETLTLHPDGCGEALLIDLPRLFEDALR